MHITHRVTMSNNSRGRSSHLHPRLAMHRSIDRSYFVNLNFAEYVVPSRNSTFS
jgi:hypothetical protein